MKHLLPGVLLGLLWAFPTLALLLAAPLGAFALWLAVQPVVWAFAAGIIARPHLTCRYGARTSGGVR